MPLWLINPGRKRRVARRGPTCRTAKGNPPHPQSYGASYPLTFGEGIGGKRKPVTIGKETAAERRAYEEIKAAGVYIPRSERGEASSPPARPVRRRTRNAARSVSMTKAPARHTHWHRVKQHKRRTNPSHAQLVARKRFAAAARAGTLQKGRTLVASKARASTSGKVSRRKEAGPMARKVKRRRSIRARRRVRHHSSNPVRRRRRRVRPVSRVARRRHRVNTHRVRRRHHRRNPGLGNIKGIGGQVLEAGKRVVVILVSSAVTKKVSGLVPVGGGSVPLTIAKQVAVGVVLAMLVRKMAPRFATDALVGALLAPVGTLLAQVPVVGGALAGAPPGLGLFSGRPTLPRLDGAPPGLGVGLGRWGERVDSGQGALASGAYYD
jgi:hypothetical protein